jgi:hypothetical protein
LISALMDLITHFDTSVAPPERHQQQQPELLLNRCAKFFNESSFF